MNDHSIPSEEPLHGHISQADIRPGESRLAVFREALRLRNTPAMYSQENVPIKQATVKFFDTRSAWTWYAVEWDGKDTCFGYVQGHDCEWGYFNIRELAAIRGLFSTGVEVDEYFTPQVVPEKTRDVPKETNVEHDFEPGD